MSSDICRPPLPASHIAPIKPEFLRCNDKVGTNVKDDTNDEEPPTKITKRRGQNKNRPREKRPDKSSLICLSYARTKSCSFGDGCNFSHDIQTFWKNKPDDLGKQCPIYTARGFCEYGIICRFAKSHVDENLNNISTKHVTNTDILPDSELNKLEFDLNVKLRKRSYDLTLSESYVQSLAKRRQQLNENACKISVDTVTSADDKIIVNENSSETIDDLVTEKRVPKSVSADHWKNRLFLAPLTTVGNLPFRRICVGLGAEITCGEMALATELLQGNKSEWALLRRHPCEKYFGVQLCGGYPDTMTKCAQVLVENCSVDFIDLNIGCPIDLICHKGAGCTLMNRTNKLSDIVSGVNSVIGSIPLTIKIRTGIQAGKNLAHTLVKNLHDWNVSACIMHGRSKEQRYTKSADWDYINVCAQSAKPTPLLGCGDILSYEDYYNRLETCNDVSGIVIARGALIKPWIFTEITERRYWDIRSSERLDILKDYVNFGLEHWGSDQRGVDTTRRFLLEWLSFLYRYVPVGLLERVPQKINERPPPYFGRDDLETLMASNNCKDWIKISEMLLGPVADDFHFLPKHKANSYE